MNAKVQHSENEPRSVRARSPLAFLSTLTKPASSYQARSTWRLRLGAVEREPAADPPTALSASCPGTFPWAGGETEFSAGSPDSKPSECPDVLASSRVYLGRLVGLGLDDGPNLKTIHEVFENTFSKCQSGTFCHVDRLCGIYGRIQTQQLLN